MLLDRGRILASEPGQRITAHEAEPATNGVRGNRIQRISTFPAVVKLLDAARMSAPFPRRERLYAQPLQTLTSLRAARRNAHAR